MEGAAHASQYLKCGELGLSYHCAAGGLGQVTELGQEEAPSVEDEDLSVRREGLDYHQEQPTANSPYFRVDLRLVGGVVCPVRIGASLPTINPHVLILLQEHIV